MVVDKDSGDRPVLPERTFSQGDLDGSHGTDIQDRVQGEGTAHMGDSVLDSEKTEFVNRGMA